MKLKKSMKLILLIPLFLSCKNEQQVFHMNTVDNIDSLKESVISKGDTAAYLLLQSYFLEVSPIEELGYDYLMATQYKYPPAFYQLAHSLLNINKVDLGNDSIDITIIDRNTRIMIIENLKLYQKSDTSNNDILRIKSYKQFDEEFSIATEE